MVVNEMVGSVTYNFIDAPPTGMAPGIPHLFTAQAVVSTRGCCKIILTHILIHCISDTKKYAFANIHTQRGHFENYKMVKWVHMSQKLTKIQGKM